MSDTAKTQDPKEVLTHLVVASDSMTAMLITKEGHNVAEAGNTNGLDTTALAALIAGMFSATREVARLVGERQFSILLQQGEERHIHISLVTDSIMMVLVFEGYQKIGKVRHEARKTGEVLTRIFQAQSMTNAGQQDQDLSMTSFKEYALNIIDRIFQGA